MSSWSAAHLVRYSCPFGVVAYFLVLFTKLRNSKSSSCFRNLSRVPYEIFVLYIICVFAVGSIHSFRISANISFRSLLNLEFDNWGSCRLLNMGFSQVCLSS
jgi:hypothetical protein